MEEMDHGQDECVSVCFGCACVAVCWRVRLLLPFVGISVCLHACLRAACLRAGCLLCRLCLLFAWLVVSVLRVVLCVLLFWCVCVLLCIELLLAS